VPHIVKAKNIADYQKKSGYSVLVETGTFMGDMVEAQRKNFEKIISIELDTALFTRAKKLFVKNHNVCIILGDSGKVLPLVVKELTEPAIFWLDGHYSSGVTARGDTDCPIFEELGAILDNSDLPHIILIDDARCYTGENDYPTIASLKKFILSKNMNYTFENKDDIIRCTSTKYETSIR
jgi:hypothetical protein